MKYGFDNVAQELAMCPVALRFQLDRDGKGNIVINGITLVGAARYGDARLHRDAKGHLYMDAGGNRRIGDGSVVTEDYLARSSHATGMRGNRLDFSMKRIAVYANSSRATGQFDSKIRCAQRWKTLLKARRTTHLGADHA